MEEREEKKRSFIHERIVPRKQYKKILSLVLTAVGLGILFGAVAGITFYVSQGILRKNNVAESLVETIVIARDEDPQNTAETGAASSKSTKSAYNAETDAASESNDGKETGKPLTDPASETEEASGEITEAAGTGEKNTSEASGDDESVSAASFDNPSAENGKNGETDGKEDPEKSKEADTAGSKKETAVPMKPGVASQDTNAASLHDMYDSISRGFVTVTIRDAEGTDLFGMPVMSRKDQCGVIVLESDEFAYILTDGVEPDPNTEITVTYAGSKIPVSVQEQDSLTGIMILRAQKEDFSRPYTVISMGNSFILSPADYVWMAGSPDGHPGAVDYGVITYIDRMNEVTDGYRQLLTTSMTRSPGGTAALFNKRCELIGWISDYSCGDSERVYAAGISPLKYVIEDLCSAVNTAYLGVTGITVTREQAEETGLAAGLYVNAVDQNSPSFMAGIQAGDRIVSINGFDMYDSRAMQNILDGLNSGDETTLIIERQGRTGDEPLEVVLIVGKR